MNTITPDEEFYDININFTVLLSELKQQIQLLQEDLLAIQNPQLRGMAQDLYVKLKIQYFDLLKDDLRLQHKMTMQDVAENVANSYIKKNRIGDKDEKDEDLL